MERTGFKSFVNRYLISGMLDWRNAENKKFNPGEGR